MNLYKRNLYTYKKSYKNADGGVGSTGTNVPPLNANWAAYGQAFAGMRTTQGGYDPTKPPTANDYSGQYNAVQQTLDGLNNPTYVAYWLSTGTRQISIDGMKSILQARLEYLRSISVPTNTSQTVSTTQSPNTQMTTDMGMTDFINRQKKNVIKKQAPIVINLPQSAPVQIKNENLIFAGIAIVAIVLYMKK